MSAEMDGVLGLPEGLVSESSLTERQLESLVLYVRVAIGEMKLREATALASKTKRRMPERPQTVGSYYRTVQQARKNIRKSIVTLLIGIWLGVVKMEDVRRLLEVAGGGIRELSDEETGQLIAVLRSLTGKIVM